MSEINRIVMQSCGQCGGIDLLLRYVREHTWFYVASIFHDNGAVTQPHIANGCICFSNDLGALLSTGTLDSSNSDALEGRFLAMPRHTASFQETIQVFPAEMIQRFDVLLFSQFVTYECQDLMKDFELPTFPNHEELMALEPDPETGLYPDQDVVGELNWDEVSTYNLFPNRKSLDDYIGIKIKQYQDFHKNQKLFCERMNTLFGVSDCE